MKNVMTIAWGIAKDAVKKFGGKVKEYFATALKIAWVQVKKVDVKSAIRLVRKKGHIVIIAVPTYLNATVTNCIDEVKNLISSGVKDGVEYSFFGIESDHHTAEFHTIVNGVHETHKVIIAKGVIA